MAAVAFLIGTVAFAQQMSPEKYGMKTEEMPEGLLVGDKAPNIEVETRQGERFSLEEALEEGPVVLVFYRGSWCPYCSRYMAGLSEALPEMKKRGARLVAVSPEGEAQMKETASISGPEIILLGDGNGEIMRAYDVDFEVTTDYQQRLDKGMDLDLKENNDQEIAVLPVPATYVINGEGEIVYRYFNLDYHERAPIKEVLKALEKL